MQFDNCPQCGAEPKFGIRAHPKFSLQVGIMPEALLTCFYAHDRASLQAISDRLSEQDYLIAAEEWDGEKWNEIQLETR